MFSGPSIHVKKAAIPHNHKGQFATLCPAPWSLNRPFPVPHKTQKLQGGNEVLK